MACNSRCFCCLSPGPGISISGTGNQASCYVISSTVSDEMIQDAVGSMLASVGLTYDDAGNKWTAGGSAGQVLTSNGAGAASWATPATGPAAAITITSPPAGYTPIVEQTGALAVRGAIRVTDEFGSAGIGSSIVDDGVGLASIRVWRNYARSVRSAVGNNPFTPSMVINNPSPIFTWRILHVGHAEVTWSLPFAAQGSTTFTLGVNGAGYAANTVPTIQHNQFAAGNVNHPQTVMEAHDLGFGGGDAVTVFSAVTAVAVTGAPVVTSYAHSQTALAASGG